MRITLLSSDVEELSRLWGMSQRNFHRLSVLYRVSVVLLEPELPTVRPLPVTDPAVTVYQLRTPADRRCRVVGAAGGDRPVRRRARDHGARSCAGDVTLVVLSDQRRQPTTADDTELRLAFDAALRTAGRRVPAPGAPSDHAAQRHRPRLRGVEHGAGGARAHDRSAERRHGRRRATLPSSSAMPCRRRWRPSRLPRRTSSSR